MLKRRRRILTGVLCLAVAFLCAFLVGCNSFFYYPDRTLHGQPADYGIEVEELSFRAPDGPELHGWWVTAVGEAQGTVVYCHGNHANLTHHARFVSWLPQRGYNLLIFDYRGYGKSAGSPDRAGTVADALAAIDLALTRDPKRTFVFGHSLGGAIGIVAAAQREAVRAVIGESTFPSYRAAARASVPWLSFVVPLVISSGLDPVDFVGKLPPRPLLVIHGSDDHILPLELGKELFAAAREPKKLYVIEGARHASPWGVLGKAFEDEVVAFLSGVLGEDAPVPPKPTAKPQAKPKPNPKPEPKPGPAAKPLALEVLAVQTLRGAKTAPEIFERVCAICHGAKGEGSTKLRTPSIAGLPKWYVLEQLAKFRTGRRGAHADDKHGQQMAVVAKALPKERLTALAALIRSKPPFATRSTLEGDIENGRLVYGEQCMECHRYNGSGEQLFRSAPLTGFQDWYLAREFEEFRTGIRGQDLTDQRGEKMRTVTQYLDEKSRRDVIAYLATLAKDYPPGK